MNINFVFRYQVAAAKRCLENNHTSIFHSAKIISEPNSIFELDFLEEFQIHKNHNNVFNYNFGIPPLLD